MITRNGSEATITVFCSAVQATGEHQHDGGDAGEHAPEDQHGRRGVREPSEVIMLST